ncbi:MAG TPA: hypothetical protein VGA67_01565 [Candidatus Dojkabacteria bacterium]
MNKIIVVEFIVAVYLFVIVFITTAKNSPEPDLNILDENPEQITEQNLGNDKNLSNKPQKQDEAEEQHSNEEGSFEDVAEEDNIIAEISPTPNEAEEKNFCFSTTYTPVGTPNLTSQNLEQYIATTFDNYENYSVQALTVFNKADLENKYSVWKVSNEEEQFFITKYKDIVEITPCELDK